MSSVFSQYTFESTKLQSPKRLFLEILKLGFVGVTLLTTSQSAYANNSQLSCKNSIAGFSKSEEFARSESAKELEGLLESTEIAEAQKTEVLQLNQSMNLEIASLGFSQEQILWVNSMIANLFEAYGVNEYKRTEEQSSIFKYKYLESKDKLVARSLELLPEESKVDSAKFSDMRKKLQGFIDEKMKLYNYVFIHSQGKKEIDQSKEQKRKDEQEKNVVALDSYVERDPTKEELFLIEKQANIHIGVLAGQAIFFNGFQYQLKTTHGIDSVTFVDQISIDQFVSIHKRNDQFILGYWTQKPSGELDLVEARDESLNNGGSFKRISDRQLLSWYGNKDIVLWTFNKDKTIDKRVLGHPKGWVSAPRILSPTKFITLSQAKDAKLWQILPDKVVTSDLVFGGDGADNVLTLSDSKFLVSGAGFMDYWDLDKNATKMLGRTTYDYLSFFHHIKVSENKVVSYSEKEIIYSAFDNKGESVPVVAIAPKGAKFQRVYLLSDKKFVALLSNEKIRSYTLPDITVYEEYDLKDARELKKIELRPILSSTESKFVTIDVLSGVVLWGLEPNGVLTKKIIDIPEVYLGTNLRGLVQEDGSYLTEWGLPVLYSAGEHKILVRESISFLEAEKKSGK